MNELNRYILDSLTVFEYKTFLKNALGFHIFNSANRDSNSLVLRRTKPRENNKIHIIKDNSIKYFAFLYDKEECVDAYYFFDSQYETKKFSSSYYDSLDVYTYFDLLKDDIILFLLIGSKETIDLPFIFKNDINAYSIINSIDIGKFRYSFILGTGISSCFSVKKWDELIKEIKHTLSNSLGTSEDKLDEFQNNIANTNYILPQIKKDYDRDEYFKLIYNSLYGKYNNQMIDIKTNPNLENQTIYQIANILSVQTLFNEKQTVLTFNYDNFLEKVFENNFLGVNVESIYKNNSEKSNIGIKIIHSHGFLPFENFDGVHKESVVLSSFEYMDTYKDYNSYAYRKLYEQLNTTNLIVGNSISDYEEQKVFRNHHNEYLSKYSFALLKKSEEPWMDAYKSKYLFSIGIIPLFFNDYPDISHFLRNRILPI